MLMQVWLDNAHKFYTLIFEKIKWIAEAKIIKNFEVLVCFILNWRSCLLTLATSFDNILSRHTRGKMSVERPKYFTPNEVSVHNTSDDLWVSFLGKVYDLTPLCEKYKGDVLLKPILAAAGKDISHWFNPKTKEIRTHVDPQTGGIIPYCPNGRFIHIPPPYPDSNWTNDFGRPWWKDDSYLVGILSGKTRFIKIINTLTSQEQVIEVCSEEIMTEILDRYLKYNYHAASYTWKYDCRNLDMTKTLEENDIPDEDEQFYELSMNDDSYLQTIHLYFNDDLTEA